MEQESPNVLPTNLAHPSFPQPTDTSIRVWRYLDLAKFIWLLENKKLFLSRLDQLQDPHEGATPRLQALLRDQQLRKFAGSQAVDLITRVNRETRRTLYVNCWHLGNSESEAMWRLYCPGDSGVAIQTTYVRLAASIESCTDCYIGEIRYIDYESGGFPWNNTLNAVMHKRASFAHEREVRIVKWLHQYRQLADSESPTGATIDWLPDDIVDAIYVNPYAPEFYHEVVRSIVRRIAPALEARVRWSQMRAAPIY